MIAKVLPKELLKSAHPLSSVGVIGFAWEHGDFAAVVNYLIDHDYFILGGDVYSLSDGEISSTDDSWYIQKDAAPTKKELLEQSRLKAVTYVDMYHRRNGSKYCYSIVFAQVIG